MKTKYFAIVFIVIILLLSGGITDFNQVQAEDSEHSDFSNAEYTLEYDRSDCILTISNISFDTTSYTYYAYFTSDALTIPDVDEIKNNYCFMFRVNKDDNLLYGGYGNLSSVVELNQDLYLWVVEGSTIVVSGEKIERPDYPEYTNVFTNASFLASTSSQLCFNFPWGTNTTRTFEIKIGKITDTTILQSLKNGDSNSLSNLLKYSKSASAIYDENLSSTSVTYSSYDGEQIISLSGLEDEAYYYLYVVFDDENGKYVPIEGVTYARANVFENQGWWSLFFQGSDNFTWTDFDVSDADTDLNSNSNEGKTDDSDSTGKNDDTTTNSSSLPYTGAFRWILLAVIIIAMIGGVCYIKTQKYKGI